VDPLHSPSVTLNQIIESLLVHAEEGALGWLTQAGPEEVTVSPYEQKFGDFYTVACSVCLAEHIPLLARALSQYDGQSLVTTRIASFAQRSDESLQRQQLTRRMINPLTATLVDSQVARWERCKVRQQGLPGCTSLTVREQQALTHDGVLSTGIGSSFQNVLLLRALVLTRSHGRYGKRTRVCTPSASQDDPLQSTRYHD
jgi:hypothetical protein